MLYVIFGLVGFETNPEEAEDRAELIEQWDHHVDWLAATLLFDA